MAGRSYKTEAVVLRSFRLGEADRILHLYTPGRGRLGAIAKGVRKARSRFGGGNAASSSRRSSQAAPRFASSSAHVTIAG